MSQDEVNAITPRSRVRAAWIGLLVIVAIIGIIDMPAMMWAGDPVVWRFEAQRVLQGKLAIDPLILPPNAEPGQLVVQNPRNGLWYSKYGMMNTIMLLVPTIVDQWFGGANILIYNLWNVLLTVALAAALMQLSGRYTQRLAIRIVFVATMLYSTFLWYYLRAQGSEIYQTLFFTLAYLFLVEFLSKLRNPKPDLRALHLVWLFVATLVFTRILYLLLIPLTLIYVIVAIARNPHESRRPLMWKLAPHLLVSPVLMCALLGLINFVKFGSPFLTGYHQWHTELHMPTGNWGEGLWGFFVMPRFSMFFYFPPLILAILQIRPFIRRYPLDALVAFSSGLTIILLIAKIPTWAGEWTYGPRYALFALPVMSLPFILLVDRLIDARKSPAAWAIAGTACCLLLYSAYLQVRVNSVDFHAYYYIREPLGSFWNEPIRDYFMDHHTGAVIADIVRHRDRPQDMPWFVELTRIRSPEWMERYYAFMSNLVDAGNHYWWKK